MEGLGNDFVVLEGPLTLDPDEVTSWTDRHRGVGADGVLVLSRLGESRVRMEVLNADGSPAETSGNGLRCAARFAMDRGWVSAEGCLMETQAGTHRVERIGSDEFRVELGRVRLDGETEVAGRVAHRASIGNPHLVLIVEDPEREDVATLGPRLEAGYAGGVNVGFVGVMDPARLRLRVWERGVGETLACGSGAAVAHALTRSLGMAETSVSVELRGGRLGVELRDEVTWISGPARYVFEGRWDPR